MSGGAGPKILHVLRSPVGGLFRHVVDLAGEQARRGLAVGIVADATTGGARAEAALAALAPKLALGVTRVAIPRTAGAGDLTALRHVAERARQAGATVLHGHGAKGGAYARLAARRLAPRPLAVYTPHGGSLHYSAASPVGLFYLAIERWLARATDLFLFESAFARDAYAAKVGRGGGIARVVYNGLGPADFEPAVAAPEARDLLFIGELRELKGIDVLVRALARLREQGRRASATIVGGGEMAGELAALATSLGLAEDVAFTGPMPARQAFALGRILVVPSRKESLPYVVLEGFAAGLPVIATRVGGIPEIFGEAADELIAPGDPEALAQAIGRFLDLDAEQRRARAAPVARRVAEHFTLAAMADQVIAAYAEAAAARPAAGQR